ncbi:MAG TPA: DUF4097 family beta strand repeat-containing protein [Candidatus Angelobacter sp.]|nr:DUF4097 family beta strand repeat-containing protein [Candidatus Angelobacter sp.]
MSAPNPAPYYRPYRQRSIFGPLVLIAIGVLFLLRNMGVISAHALGFWFARYWPVVLIVLGLVKLAEYMWARSQGRPAPRLGAGAIVFLVFFIIIGTTTTRVADWNWRGIHDQMDADNPDFGDFFGWMGQKYDFTDNFAQPLEKGAQIKVVGARGDIKITPSQDAQAHVVVEKTIRAESQQAANNLSQNAQPKFEQQGSIWVLDLSNGRYNVGRFNLTMQLPQDSAVSVSARRGDVSVSGVRTVDLATDHGDLTAEQIKGDANLRLRGGTLTVKDVTGNVQVNGEVDDSNVSGVGGSLEFDAGYNGQVQLAKIGKQVHFKSIRTDLQLPKLDGEMTLGDGNLRGSTLTGPVRLETRSNDIHLDDVSGEVRVQNRSGVVELAGKAPLGPIDITNVHGGIELRLPDNANFQVDATSTSGNIESDFTGLTIDNSHRDATARGSVGKGGPELRLRAEQGTIQIRKQ